MQRTIKRNIKFFNLGLAVLTFFIGFPAVNYTQDDAVPVKTELITVPVSVLDKQGRYITDLKKENFQVFEDGVEQEVAAFEPVEQPLTIIVLVDASISMKDQKDILSFVNSIPRTRSSTPYLAKI
jgi:hypothetical protein